MVLDSWRDAFLEVCFVRWVFDERPFVFLPAAAAVGDGGEGVGVVCGGFCYREADLSVG